MQENPKKQDSIDATFWRVLDFFLELLVILLLASAALISGVQVFFRYVLNASLAWPEELSQWVFVWAVFLGMALLTGKKHHITVDLFSSASPQFLHIREGLIKAIITVASLALVIHGMEFVNRSMQATAALQWPLKYLFIAAPIGAAFNLLYLLRDRDMEYVRSMLWVALGGGVYFLAVLSAGDLYGAEQNITVLLTVSLVLILFGVPVVFVFVVGVFLALLPMGAHMLVLLPQNMSASLNSFTLLAIPFFVFAAAFMNAGGITTRLMNLAMRLVGHWRGGLGQANVLTNVMMAGVSGSSTADASAIAKLMVPEMKKHGYDPAFSCAVTSSSATLANLIPPGLGLIIYGSLASVSIGALFVATIVPGLLVAFVLGLVVYFVSRKNGYGVNTAKSSSKMRLDALRVALPALILPVVIVGGVRFGVFTATEAGAIAIFFALFCGAFFYKVRTFKAYYKAAQEAATDTVAVVLVIAAASPFAWILAFEQIPQNATAILVSSTESTTLALLMITVLLLCVGLFMEMIAAMVILVPILVPVVVSLGVDPIHFGIVLILNLVIGALTPPLGVLVFTTARVGNTPATQVFVAIIPFVLAMIGVLLVITFVPALTMLPVKYFGP